MNHYPKFSRLVSQSLNRSERSLAWLSLRLGVHKSTVTRWVNYDSRPSSTEIVIEVADVLGIERNLLLVAAGYGYIGTNSTDVSSGKIEMNNYSNYYPKFGELVNEHMYKKDCTTSWLAQQLNANASTVNRWLNHGTRPGLSDMVIRIAEILEIDTQELLHAAGYGYMVIENEPIETTSSVGNEPAEGRSKVVIVPPSGDDFQPNTSEPIKNETQNTFICNVVARGDIRINIELSNHEHLHQYDTLINNVESKEGSVCINIKQATQAQNEADNAMDESQEPEQEVQLHLFEQSTDNQDENQYAESFVQQLETVGITI